MEFLFTNDQERKEDTIQHTRTRMQRLSNECVDLSLIVENWV